MTVYGPIALIVDIIFLQCLGLCIFLSITFKRATASLPERDAQLGRASARRRPRRRYITPPQFVLNKVANSGKLGHALNFAMTVAICETIMVPLRLLFAVVMVPKVAAVLPPKWKPTKLR